MKKIDLLNKQIITIEDCSLVRCIFTDNLIYKEEDLRINLYLYINKVGFQEVFKIVNDLMFSYNVLLHDEHNQNENHDFSTYYFENGLNYNIYYLYDYSYFTKNNIVSLYNPLNIIENFNTQKFPLTNKEFANTIEKFCKEVFEFYNLYIQDDKIGAYSKVVLSQKVFVLIYRGFYDSTNAKKEFIDTKLMNIKFYNNLLILLKSLKFDNMLEHIQMLINEIDKMINQIPVNIITLFNFDFYTHTRKLIFSL